MSLFCDGQARFFDRRCNGPPPPPEGQVHLNFIGSVGEVAKKQTEKYVSVNACISQSIGVIRNTNGLFVSQEMNAFCSLFG
jgi:hypothetical protein